MKKLSRLELILAAAICLILFVFIKGNIGNNNEKSQAHNVTHNDAYQASSASRNNALDSQTRPTRITQTQKNNETLNTLICDKNCQDDISKSLVTEGLLSPDMIARIRENPKAFAEKLSNTPEILSDLLLTLKADEEDDNGTQNAALAVLQALSDEDKLALAKTLTTLARDQDRIVGLELLELSLETQAGSVETLNGVLENEAHPSVLAKAINIASNLPKETEVQGTLHALTEIIHSSSSDHFSGTALLAKINIAPSPDSVYEDISASLASFSDDKTAFGLTALQTALQRDDSEFGSEGRWYDDLSLRKSVRAIAQNQDVNEDTRAQAQHLLNSYFSDD